MTIRKTKGLDIDAHEVLAIVIAIVSPSTFNIYSLGTYFVPEFSSYPLSHFRQTPSALEPHPPKILNSGQKNIFNISTQENNYTFSEEKLSMINRSSNASSWFSMSPTILILK